MSGKGRGVSHGHSLNRVTSKTYNAWKSMIQRCTNPRNKYYHCYGGRGITVCKEWLNSYIPYHKGFPVFLQDMGECPLDLTLERIDNNKGYYKENCKWAIWTEQRKNQRQGNQYMVTK